MTLKAEFDNAYEMLCDKLYKESGYSYKELKGRSKEAEVVIDELMDIKTQVDSKLKYFVRSIYRKLKISYDG